MLCKSCDKKLEYIKEPICKKCGKQLEIDEQEYCGDCKKYMHVYDSGLGIFAYTDDIKKCIYDFKYNDMKIYAKFFGAKMAERSVDYIKHWDADVIIPVPVSKEKYVKRGYNQAAELAEALGREMGIPVYDNLIIRKVNTKPLKNMSPAERQNSLKKAFILRKDQLWQV